ncbi:MAG: thioesterase domain-containing protein [Bacteroidota bacterium]
MNRVKLFCFPYAGGSAVIYNKWKKYAQMDVEIIPVELAGRGKRLFDEPYGHIDQAVEDVYQIVVGMIGHHPYALFGHSMGSIIAYKLAQKLRRNNLPAPLHLFFSGNNAPHLEREDKKKYHLMDDEEFKEEVLELGGTPEEFFSTPELVETFLPGLKNDFKIAETEELVSEISPFRTNISILLGKEDDLSAEECHGWAKHTTKICNMYYFNGGHFFINEVTRQVVERVCKTLGEEKLAQSNPI